MSKFEEYQAVAESLADCKVCGHDRADIIESGEAFYVECFACGERTGEHESYQCAAKEWSEGVDIKQAIELTKTFNQWRRGEADETLTMDELDLEPARIGEALDTLVNFAEVTVMTQEFLAGEAVNFSSLDVDKDSPVCCHTCNRKAQIHQFNPSMIKCPDCGKRDCRKADWHGSECENAG